MSDYRLRHLLVFPVAVTDPRGAEVRGLVLDELLRREADKTAARLEAESDAAYVKAIASSMELTKRVQ
jgi:hypothetical protein